MSEELPDTPAPSEPLPEITPQEIEETAAGNDATDPDATLAKRLSRTGPRVLRFTLRDQLILTYAVPAERLRPHLPENLPLDMLPGPDGERLAFVQTLCAYHENARWAALPEKVGQSFHQITYRILTRRAGRRGAFILRLYTSTDEGRAAQRALSRDADFARFSIYIAGNPARATYSTYTVRATGDQGQTQIDARIGEAEPDQESAAALPAPFFKSDEIASYMVDRPDNYFRSSAPKSGIGLLPIHYGTIPAPTFATLNAPPRLSLWNSLRILSAEEMQKPHSLMIFPIIETTSFTPQFARLNRK